MQRFFVSGSPRDILEILTHISLPRGAHLSVELLELGADQDLDLEHLPILAAVLPRSATRLPALADVRHLMVWFEQFKLTIYADEDRTEFWESQAWKTSDYKCSPSDGDTPVMPALCMAYHLPGSEVDHYLLVNVMRELGQYFSSSLETLIVHGIMDIVETETWAGVLAAFPQLEYLEVISRECDMKYFPAALEPTPTATPCRGLRKLVLRYEPNDEDGGLQMLNALCVALQKRDEAHCRLQSLSLQVEPVTIDTMYTPSTAVSRLPADFEDIQEKLEILVDSLEVMLLIDGD
ncbi:hypothetical protein EVJ58_g5020 [Rhodofomes roseus]|uniref:Uncharacterized protein n=1 Tax=Rhodofomes roseus TaxID=34475 RepID=A0A4Y9YGF1_9APHY|nr:hypothetical protein EVJ58_g5020 [Rhodofomes roseus]